VNRKERRAEKAKTGKFKGSDSRLEGAELKYQGRTLSVHVVLNTDESLEAVVERLRQAAPGPKRVMVLLAGGELHPQDAELIWNKTWHAAEETVKREN
jgi:hypothetical protein